MSMASLATLSQLGFSIGGFPIEWYQIVGLVLLIGLIIFWVMYRKRQM